MTDSVLPPGLANLPYPWNISSDDVRRRAISDLPRDSEQRELAFRAVQKSLDFLVDYHFRYGEDGDSDDLPEQFYETWVFFENSFNERMPTLADVSVDSIRRWLTEEVDLGLLFGDGFVRLPPDLPDAFGRFWAPAKVGAINTHLMRWLIGAIRACPDAAERAPLLALLKAAVPRAGWYIGQSLLGYISDLGGDLERDFFIAVEGDLEIHERTREEAARLRKIIESSAR